MRDLVVRACVGEGVVMVMGAASERLRRCYTDGVFAYAAGQRGTRNPYDAAEGGTKARAEDRW